MKIGLAQVNTTVGDLAGNVQKVVGSYRRLCEQGAEIVVFPEMVICGYPPRDLLFKTRFASDTEEALQAAAREIGEVPAAIGFAEPRPNAKGRPCSNAAAWCRAGRVEAVGRKCLLPTYDVFDEDRYFAAASEPLIVSFGERRIGITICEDIWTGPIVDTSKYYGVDPLRAIARANPDLILNLSASPWHFSKGSFRRDLIQSAAERSGCPVVYCNAVGGNDELIFDGHSMVVAPDGRLIAGMAGFVEAETVVDIEGTRLQIHPTFEQEPLADIYAALVLGLGDYAFKSGFQKALLGLSGGIDSALTAALAVETFGPANVTGISLPSEISSDHSRADAAMLAKNLGIRFETLPIGPLVKAAEQTLEPLFKGLERDVTEENIQARSRGLLLMAVSNKTGALLLTTGNKSEFAVGYSTLYGDMCGGLAVISDLPKTKVFELARWINRKQEIIPWNTIEKPPSAELRPDQKDEDSLPPYPILDRILELYVEAGQSRAEIIAEGFDPAIVHDVTRKVDLNEYKRKQAPPGLKITPLAFGVGRRIPIVQRYVN